MPDIHVRIDGEEVTIWRTELIGKGKSVRVPGTTHTQKRGEKFSPDLPAFKSRKQRAQEKGE